MVTLFIVLWNLLWHHNQHDHVIASVVFVILCTLWNYWFNLVTWWIDDSDDWRCQWTNHATPHITSCLCPLCDVKLSVCQRADWEIAHTLLGTFWMQEQLLWVARFFHSCLWIPFSIDKWHLYEIFVTIGTMGLILGLVLFVRSSMVLAENCLGVKSLCDTSLAQQVLLMAFAGQRHLTVWSHSRHIQYVILEWPNIWTPLKLPVTCCTRRFARPTGFLNFRHSKSLINTSGCVASHYLDADILPGILGNLQSLIYRRICLIWN